MVSGSIYYEMGPAILAELIKRDVHWMRDPQALHWPVTKKAFDILMKDYIKNMPPVEDRTSCGIVMAGGGKYDAGIYVGIKMLRLTGCTLPVQVWHRGSNDEPISNAIRMLENVEVCNLYLDKRVKPARSRGGYQNKHDAILACGWRYVIFFDADVYPLQDPATLFGHFNGNGLILWPDLETTGMSLQYRNYDLDESDPIEAINTGHSVWDVTKSWQVLCLADFFDDYPEYYYQHKKGIGGFGDQDALRAAIKILKHPYTMFTKDHGYKPGMFVQKGPDGEDFWVHRCKSKFGPEKDWDDRHIATFRSDLPLEKEAWEYYKEWQKLVGAS